MKVRIILALVAIEATVAWQTVVATTRTVTNLNDSGGGSLRDTIAASASGDAINFSVTGTIMQTNELVIARNLTIIGPITNVLTVSGNKTHRVFNVTAGTVTISGLTIANGQDDGGGIYNAGTLTIYNCTISSNKASFEGGGIYNSGALTINNCTISRNSSVSDGGGIYNIGTFTINNCTVSSNSATFDGGGIYNSSVLAINNCTVSGNSAGFDGGGIRANGGSIGILNTVVAGNYSPPSVGGGPDVYGAFTSQGHNLIGKIDGSSGWGGNDLTGTVALPLNPLLGSLQDNGGPTFTMALHPTSAAIDAGADSVTNSLATDQRGRPRRLAAHVDIGAFEVIPDAPMVSIARSSNKVVLSWSTNAAGFTLESTPTLLNSSNTWATAGSPTIIGSQYSVTNTAASGSRLYRLRTP